MANRDPVRRNAPRHYLQRWQVPIFFRLLHRFDAPSPNASPQPHTTICDAIGHIPLSLGHIFHRLGMVVPEVPISRWIVVIVTIPEVIISHGHDPLLSDYGMSRVSSWGTPLSGWSSNEREAVCSRFGAGRSSPGQKPITTDTSGKSERAQARTTSAFISLPLVSGPTMIATTKLVAAAIVPISIGIA